MFEALIMKTYLYNFELEFTGVYNIFFIFLLKSIDREYY